jgi:hypothetical protein
MGAVDIGGRRLIVSEDAISFGDAALPTSEVEGITIDRSDDYSHGIWVGGTRSVAIRGKQNAVHVDFSPRKSSDRAKVDELFDKVLEEIWSVVGSRLAARVMNELADDETVCIGGVRLNRHGVWVEGPWRFLWLKAKPRLIPWAELKVRSESSGALYLQSKSDLRLWSEINYNKNENSLVLDGVVRSLSQGCEPGDHANPRVPLAKHGWHVISAPTPRATRK